VELNLNILINYFVVSIVHLDILEVWNLTGIIRIVRAKKKGSVKFIKDMYNTDFLGEKGYILCKIISFE